MCPATEKYLLLWENELFPHLSVSLALGIPQSCSSLVCSISVTCKYGEPPENDENDVSVPEEKQEHCAQLGAGFPSPFLGRKDPWTPVGPSHGSPFPSSSDILSRMNLFALRTGLSSALLPEQWDHPCTGQDLTFPRAIPGLESPHRS